MHNFLLTIPVVRCVSFLMVSDPCEKYSGRPLTSRFSPLGGFHTLLLEALWTIKSLLKNPERVFILVVHVCCS